MSRCIHSRILLTECASESLYSVQNIANIRIRVIFDSSNTLVYRLGTLTDTPLLSCAVCGQGTHDQCISKFLHLTELECRSFTTADAWSRINPTKLPGLHYLCMECTFLSMIAKLIPSNKLYVKHANDAKKTNRVKYGNDTCGCRCTRYSNCDCCRNVGMCAEPSR